MVTKFVIAVGVILTVGAWVLAVPYAPEVTQLSMKSSTLSP